MSRHRNVRTRNFSDEYDGYDDVYGHSIEDDYCMSPSEAAFMYDREGSRNQQKIGAYLQSVKDIVEEDEMESSQSTLPLSDIDQAKLESCLEQLKSTFGSSVTQEDMVKAIISHNFNVEEATTFIFDNVNPNQQTKKEKVLPSSTTYIPVDPEMSAIKIIAPSAKVTNITKGFDLNPKEINRLNTTPRSQSPSSGRGTPASIQTSTEQSAEDLKNFKQKDNKVDVLTQYKNERSNLKENLYMVVIGHVDAGKSTLMGHLLCSLEQVNQKLMHKFELESKKMGKQSFMYAWVLDETGEERNRGITMDVGRSQFETKTKRVTLLDAPGHKDFIPNMISGAVQADVALLVVDATRGEFETGFDYGGQTREHALLVRSLGVTQLTVAVNKLDTVSWSKERFTEIVHKLKAFLKIAGFKDSDVAFVPCSGLTGQNLVNKPTENELLSWYNGPCLLQVIDNFRSPERPVSKPFRLPINDIYKSTGSGFCISGRLETGSLTVGDRVLVCPSKELAIVKALGLEDVSKSIVFAGDEASITLSGIEMQNVAVGDILCDPQYPLQIASKFQARIVIFNITIPITKGFSIVLHHQNLVEPAIISKLISQLNKSSGEVIKKHPRCLGNNSSAIVEIQAGRPIALELYSDCKELGRITIRIGGFTIAAGLIIKIIP